jgi:YesN/AraC family two-component response regulator
MQKQNSVLVVEDDPGLRYLTQIILSNTGTFNVINTSSNGIEALESIKHNGIPDCIFLDIAMPQMNGIEFLEAFQKNYIERPEKTRIIILSSYDSYYYKKEVIKYNNVTDYVLKPLTKEKAAKLFNE